MCEHSAHNLSLGDSISLESTTKTGKVTRKLVRSPYLIDEEGVIAKAFGKVKAKDNAKQMLDELA